MFSKAHPKLLPAAGCQTAAIGKSYLIGFQISDNGANLTIWSSEKGRRLGRFIYPFNILWIFFVVDGIAFDQPDWDDPLTSLIDGWW